jgi:polysaccharide deacetylase 2 family uncharacterized protein YibQ
MAAKRKKNRKKKGKSRNLGPLVLVLLAAIVCSLALYKYSDTPAGNVFLLDMGVGSRYEAVRSDLEVRIIDAAVGAGVSEGRISISQAMEPESPGPVSLVKGEVPAQRSLTQVNAAIDLAVRVGGGRVRSCRETRGGRAIEMEIGTRRIVTHRCTFKLGKPSGRKDDQAGGYPVMTIIVDDFGYFNNKLVREYLALEVPVTISVIPGLKHSSPICKQAAGAGKEVICHLPMEPEKDAGDQGDIPLVRVDMSDGKIEGVVERALESTPGAIGMNNHMGSKATADQRVMDAVIRVCRRKELFFLDSVTTPRSKVSTAAARGGVRSLKNDIFIDNRGEDVRDNMRKMMSIASRKGKVTGIMHVRRENLKHLRWLEKEARKEGIRIIKLSEMIGS